MFNGPASEFQMPVEICVVLSIRTPQELVAPGPARGLVAAMHRRLEFAETAEDETSQEN